MKIIMNALLIVVSFSSQISLAAQNEQNKFVKEATQFVDLLVKGNFAVAVGQFDETMKSALPPDKLQGLWQSLNAQLGNFKKELGARIEKAAQYEIVYVTCEFEKSTVDLKLVFNQNGLITGLFIVPTEMPVKFLEPAYADRNLFTEKEVTVGTGEFALRGTLAMPKGKELFPAIVLVHGSGPNDRDETIGGSKPFRDLAWGLASKGIAVLRYEKRTLEHGKRLASIKNFTVKEEVIDDAVSAVDLLRKTEGIDTKRIFVLGHSLGGMLVPRIGKADPKIAGFIVLAGSTRPVEDMIVEQSNYLASLNDNLTEEERKRLESFKEFAAQVKKLRPEDAAANKIFFGAPASYYLDLRGYSPPETAKRLKQPFLILQGERDYQVTMVDFQNWRNALSKKKNVTFKTYQKLNHLFIAGEGAAAPSEYSQTGNVAETVVVDIAEWIGKH
jgi:dienelactone hydrolase